MMLPAEITGVLGWVVLTLPFAVLATVILLGASRRASRKAAAADGKIVPSATERYGAPVERPRLPTAPVRPVAVPTPPPEGSGKPAATTAPATGTVVPGNPAAATAERPAGADAAAQRALQTREPELRAEISRAQSRGEEIGLAALYNQLALTVIAAGRPNEAGDMLRSAIRLSSKFGQRVHHARARLELGDLAFRSGDATTACEHWQLARGLYYDEGRAAELEKCEERMSRNGCPTDWVLNDF